MASSNLPNRQGVPLLVIQLSISTIRRSKDQEKASAKGTPQTCTAEEGSQPEETHKNCMQKPKTQKSVESIQKMCRSNSLFFSTRKKFRLIFLSFVLNFQFICPSVTPTFSSFFQFLLFSFPSLPQFPPLSLSLHYKPLNQWFILSVLILLPFVLYFCNP